MPEPITNIKVKLVGKDGNVFNIIGIVREALRKGGRKDLIPTFTEEATSGDYNHAIATCMKYVHVY